jgi:serine/threonine-protein kinase
MSEKPCSSCGGPLTDGLCPSCDITGESDDEIEVDVVVGDEDPLIGRVIADRYEIRSLHGTGGMARIYRAVQRSLGREVVVKVINPELLAQDETTAEESVTRFMVEAQAASKLNHPNVVSVFDFGRTSRAEGGLLFLVMEFLAGKDLWTVHREDPNIPIPRIANILRQVLAALGEAHYLGIAHRDIKPENIVVEPTRSGRDLVKVIDFGLAKLGARSVTRAGQTVGTPSYMAPEQIAGSALGSSDLYAVGVILYELLTGQLPFDGTPLQILRQHLTQPRPDPRSVAPNRGIPAALAAVCVRAMDIDPARRWPDAESLSEAIVRAAGSAEWTSRHTVPRFGAVTGPASIRNVMPPPVPSRKVVGPALLAREAELTWASKLFGAEQSLCLALHGSPGVGRSRMLSEIATAAEHRGMRVVNTRGPRAPHREITYATLRTIIAKLVGADPGDASLANGELAGADGGAAAGLLAVFGGILQAPAETRTSAASALRWAVQRAGVDKRPVLLAIDDVDRLDNASRRAVFDALAAPLPGLFALTTSLAPVDLPSGRVAQRALPGLTAFDAVVLLDQLGGSADNALARRTDEVEPLYVDLLKRWKLDGSQRQPAKLQELVETSFELLRPHQRRLLLVVSALGGGPLDEITALGRRDDATQALGPLVESGILETDADGVHVTHEIFARVALATAPGGAVGEIHAAAAERLAGDDARRELRVYHALRGRPDFETFMLAEDAAAFRASAGDEEGAIEVLTSGLRAGKAMLRHGDVEGGSACAVFGQKLGAMLRELGRDAEAITILADALKATGPEDTGRMRILEELARAAGSLGQPAESERWRREALAIARKKDDRASVQRLVNLARE